MAEVKQQSRSKKFAKDFGIYAIGNLGSRLLTAAMYPLYSYFVEDTSSFGQFDLCLLICLLLTPVVTLQLRDGAFRFLLDNKDKEHRTRVVTYVYRTLFLSIVTTAVIALIISLFFPYKYLWYTVTLLVVMAIYEVVAQVIRGLENNKAFITVGLSGSAGITIFSIIFVVCLDMKVEGIFLANILARIMAVVIVEARLKTLRRFFRIKADFRAISKDILKFSLPLIPVTMCGLLPPVSDRLFIQHFLGFEHAGIYSMAMKLAGLINILSMIFYKTWQENAILQYNSSDRDKFFSNIFNGYVFLLAIVLIGYIFTIKICSFIIGPAYQQSIAYLLPVGIAWVMIAITNYFYIPYQCANDTKSSVPSVAIILCTNLVLNYLLVPRIGIYGVVVTSVCGNLLVQLYLWHSTKQYFNLSVRKNTIMPILMIALSLIPFYLNPNRFFDFIYIIIAEVILLLLLPKDFKEEIVSKIKKVTQKFRAT